MCFGLILLEANGVVWKVSVSIYPTSVSAHYAEGSSAGDASSVMMTSSFEYLHISIGFMWYGIGR